MLSGKWIWCDTADVRRYNRMARFRREFEVRSIVSAELRITADSWYRLRLNGEWVADGPARFYPEHCRYDVLDAAPYLKIGVNVLEVEVRYFGCGNFHQLPQRAGLLAELAVVSGDGATTLLTTDETWQAARVEALLTGVPRQSVQFAPFEFWDNRRQPGEWGPAVTLGAAGEGPYADFQPRDVQLLSRHTVDPARLVWARAVAPAFPVIGTYAGLWCFPGSDNMNHDTLRACLVGANLVSPTAQKIRLVSVGNRVSVNGVPANGGEIDLTAGDNLLLALPQEPCSHWADSGYIGFPGGLGGARVMNPGTGAPGIAVRVFPEFLQLGTDVARRNVELAGRFREAAQEWMARTVAVADFAALPGDRLDLSPADCAGCAAPINFAHRKTLPVEIHVREAENALCDSAACAVIEQPENGADAELCFDFGDQHCGYWEIAFTAAAGTLVDLNAVEYVGSGDRVQHTEGYLNGLRLIAREGGNRYLSTMRRSGRYLFLTVRNQTGPLRLQFLRVIESGYPVSADGGFRSSDPRLDAIWQISRRTLELCMEDTFTDCPLYEQTLWIGDARNEALFAFETFGAYDLVRRSLRLGGESLDRLPIVGCQVPSGWDALIPAWSMFWGESVWEYWFETGDRGFLEEIFPRVEQNLSGLLRYIDDATGLFRMKAWNLLEWSATDSSQETMVYNSMLLISALDCGARCADVLGRDASAWRAKREQLAQAVARVFDVRRGAWPDSITDGEPSRDVAVHTSMLAIRNEIVGGATARVAATNMLNPRKELIAIGSPFATFFYFEALLKLGRTDRVLEELRRDYGPMLEAGATTVWEVFPNSATSGQFPTRSHCHAWSAAPLWVLPHAILGLRMTEPGAAKFTISPEVGELEFAAGRRPTVRGIVEVGWRKNAERLLIECRAPESIALEYVPTPGHSGLKVEFRRLQPGENGDIV